MYLLWRFEMKSASKSHALLNNTSANEVFIQDLVNRAEAYAHLARATAIQFSVVHTLSEYYILIIARFVRGYAVFERVLARQALGAIL